MTKYLPNNSIIGARVELMPHLDMWMRGARYGAIVGIRARKLPGEAYLRTVYTVKLDKFSKPIRVTADQFSMI